MTKNIFIFSFQLFIFLVIVSGCDGGHKSVAGSQAALTEQNVQLKTQLSLTSKPTVDDLNHYTDKNGLKHLPRGSAVLSEYKTREEKTAYIIHAAPGSMDSSLDGGTNSYFRPTMEGVTSSIKNAVRLAKMSGKKDDEVAVPLVGGDSFLARFPASSTGAKVTEKDLAKEIVTAACETLVDISYQNPGLKLKFVDYSSNYFEQAITDLTVSKKTLIDGCNLSSVVSDITTLGVTFIVNAANTEGQFGSGVSHSIHDMLDSIKSGEAGRMEKSIRDAIEDYWKNPAPKTPTPAGELETMAKKHGFQYLRHECECRVLLHNLANNELRPDGHKQYWNNRKAIFVELVKRVESSAKYSKAHPNAIFLDLSVLDEKRQKGETFYINDEWDWGGEITKPYDTTKSYSTLQISKDSVIIQGDKKDIDSFFREMGKEDGTDRRNEIVFYRDFKSPDTVSLELSGKVKHIIVDKSCDITTIPDKYKALITVAP